ncbi:MAG: SlyX family protein [Gammaproteobacteria bacterium]|nr:SlyX family protein [Gammaproteobacteria bacterium]
MEERLYALEIKLMELEQTVSELNDVLTEQFKVIDQLEYSNRQLNSKIAALGEADETDVRDEPPPPHY